MFNKTKPREQEYVKQTKIVKENMVLYYINDCIWRGMDLVHLDGFSLGEIGMSLCQFSMCVNNHNRTIPLLPSQITSNGSDAFAEDLLFGTRRVGPALREILCQCIHIFRYIRRMITHRLSENGSKSVGEGPIVFVTLLVMHTTSMSCKDPRLSSIWHTTFQ